MRRRDWLLTIFVVAVAVASAETNVADQVYIREEPAPIVTAENEAWYLAGEPITHAGSLYYPAGPQVYFDQREMVRSGDYRGIPIYTRTTIEPFSKVFVPLAGRLMQPYERRRAGELAGTVGSSAPSFPIETAAGEVFTGIPQAAAPPTRVEPIGGVVTAAPETVGATAVPAGTTGTVEEIPPPSGPLTTAQKPVGINAVFIDFQDRRWYSSGPAIEFDGDRFVRIGDYHGFPVYVEKDGDKSRIYVTVARQTQNLVTPYSDTKP